MEGKSTTTCVSCHDIHHQNSTKHRQVAEGATCVSCHEAGKPKSPGFLDDYAFLAQGLLALHRATNDTKWLDAARELAAQMKQRFQN